jgi:hypothetical protein
MADRSQNEKEYKNWEELPDGGRRYWRDRKGRVSGFQRIIKVVDADENTLKVMREIYSDAGELVEYHQKYPEDTGHQVIETDDDESGTNDDHTSTC